MNQIARLYVGTYSRPLIFGTGEVFEGKGKGIHAYLFDMEKGTIQERELRQRLPILLLSAFPQIKSFSMPSTS